MNSLLIIALQMIAALCIDKLIGEFPKYHPLVGFGNIANWCESRFNREAHSHLAKLKGQLCCLALVMPLPIFIFLIASPSIFYILLETFILYLAIGQQSLAQHAMQIYQPLVAGDLAQARHYTGYIVSRETSELSENEMARATVESVLENGHDAVLASLVYFLIGGAPLVILHRLVNTLDAMWGYKTPRFLYFGWFSAKFDDILGFFTAILSSVLYSLAP
ncbi:CobD/CbiB family cobalamin biosynthesis protein [Paraglaciecola aquimarina]|uniref:Cobalamin biosynthesis protein CobD n=1 Tax=Paraglaciecola aquimarina TaxID=1235557 RepID=A0ABU3T120_9ALTE|nr:CobD/CbiB family cobalamin biosynthesis protein [Paraglaciecola aquimarina]MDU0355969.1 CobD/CbiB family cobalamin biosynthesis protein [Paraglaciecola aquimarina]